MVWCFYSLFCIVEATLEVCEIQSSVHQNPDFLRHNFVFDGRGRVGARNNVPKSGRSDPRWTCIVPNTLLYSTHNVFYTTHFIVTNALYSTVRIVHFLNCSYFVKLTVLRLKMPFDFLSYFGFLANCLFLQHSYISVVQTQQKMPHRKGPMGGGGADSLARISHAPSQIRNAVRIASRNLLGHFGARGRS